VDILIVNCSLFNPTPSLSAMIVNHFKMKSNVVSYNLSGMGCSAGVIAISLAKELLQVCAWSDYPPRVQKYAQYCGLPCIRACALPDEDEEGCRLPGSSFFARPCSQIYSSLVSAKGPGCGPVFRNVCIRACTAVVGV
jgi:hypothetical protein